jgi:hypothetical protein
VDVKGPLRLDLITFESTSAVVLFQSPLQAKPFIAKVSGRPSELLQQGALFVLFVFFCRRGDFSYSRAHAEPASAALRSRTRTTHRW